MIRLFTYCHLPCRPNFSGFFHTVSFLHGALPPGVALNRPVTGVSACCECLLKGYHTVSCLLAGFLSRGHLLIDHARGFQKKAKSDSAQAPAKDFCIRKA